MSAFDPSAGAVRGPSRCAAALRLTEAELAVLLDQPERVADPLRQVRCELADHRDGHHLAFVMAVDGADRWWWARWNGLGRAVLPLHLCDALGPGLDECLLPTAHSGPHSFEI